MTRKFAGLAIASFATMFALYGCGDSGTTNATPVNSSASSEKDSANTDDDDDSKGNKTIEAETFSDLPKCSAKKQGTIATVEEDEVDYYCFGTEWIETVKSAKKLPDCTTKKEGTHVYVTSDEEVLVCNDNEWTSIDDEGEDDGDDDDDTPESSSSKSTKKSSDSNSDVEPVELIDGVIWQPSYGRRAWTGAEGVNGDNFLAEDDDGAGWWYKFLDDDIGGKSDAKGVFSASDLTLTFSLAYVGWHEVEWVDGKYSGIYYAPDPYPFAGFGFNLRKEKETMNLPDLSSGICITYTSTTKAKISIASKATDGTGIAYEYNLSSKTSAYTAKIAWADFVQPSYAADQNATVARASALAKAYALQIMYSNDQAGVTDACGSSTPTLSACQSAAATYGSSTFKVYKIEKYDGLTCGASSSSDNTL